MVRVAARALALARRRVAGHADRAVTRPAARAFPAAPSTAVIAARFAGAVRRAAHPELRGRRLRAQAAAAALVGATGSTVRLAAIRERVAVSAQGQYDGGDEERTACDVFHRAPPGPRASNAGVFASSRTRGRTGRSHRRGSRVKRFSGTRSSHAARSRARPAPAVVTWRETVIRRQDERIALGVPVAGDVTHPPSALRSSAASPRPATLVA